MLPEAKGSIAFSIEEFIEKLRKLRNFNISGVESGLEQSPEFKRCCEARLTTSKVKMEHLVSILLLK